MNVKDVLDSVEIGARADGKLKLTDAQWAEVFTAVDNGKNLTAIIRALIDAGLLNGKLDSWQAEATRYYRGWRIARNGK